MPRQGAVTLSDLLAPTLTLICGPCERKGRYSVAGLMAKHGDARLTDLRSFLTVDCPQRVKSSIDAQCKAIFDPPPEMRREVKRKRPPAIIQSATLLHALDGKFWKSNMTWRDALFFALGCGFMCFLDWGS